MRIGIKVVVAAALALLLSLPAAAISQAPLPAAPDIPNIPKGLPQGDVERFEVTVAGDQHVRTEFAFDAAPSVPCSVVGRGSLSESWSFRRGKGVVISFRKLGPGLVVLQRDGRGLGDSAMALKGSMRREATGSVMARAPIDCLSFPLKTPACEKTHAVNSDARLGWEKGMLSLEESSTANTAKNPALACGMTSVWNFDELGTSFPALYPQRAALPLGKIFNSKANINIRLKARFLEPAEPPTGYTIFHESLSGFTTVTLKRL